MVDGNGVAKITDFGISILKEANDTILSINRQADQVPQGEQSVSGSLRWMSPERLNGEPVTQAVDVYSYGITCWEVIAFLILVIAHRCSLSISQRQ